MTVKEGPLVPTVKVALFALVIAGAWFTVRVKLCVAFGFTPLFAVIVAVTLLLARRANTALRRELQALNNDLEHTSCEC